MKREEGHLPEWSFGAESISKETAGNVRPLAVPSVARDPRTDPAPDKLCLLEGLSILLSVSLLSPTLSN